MLQHNDGTWSHKPSYCPSRLISESNPTIAQWNLPIIDLDLFDNDNKISVSEDIFNRGVCLPSDTKMTNEEQDRVVKIIRGLFK